MARRADRTAPAGSGRMSDVAALAGVSPATVSRHINGQRVRAADRVQQAIEQLQFTPSEAARSLKLGRTRSVAIVSEEATNPYFSLILKGAEAVAREVGYTVVLHSMENSDGGQAVANLARRVDGVILVPQSEQDQTARQLHDAGVPVVLLDGEAASLAVSDMVLTDNVSGAHQAAQYLLQLGHRRIALLNSPLERTVGRQRREGFLAALAENGVTIDDAHDVIGARRYDGAYSAVIELFAHHRPPTAVFSTGSLLTVGALRAISDLGLSMPDEVSFLAFDDMELLDMLTPPITVVSRATEKHGVLAMRFLLARLNGPSAAEPRRAVLPSTLIIRGSCARPPG